MVTIQAVKPLPLPWLQGSTPLTAKKSWRCEIQPSSFKSLGKGKVRLGAGATYMLPEGEGEVEDRWRICSLRGGGREVEEGTVGVSWMRGGQMADHG